MHNEVKCGWQNGAMASRSAFWAIVGAASGSFGLGYLGLTFLGPSIGEQGAAMAFAALFGPGAAFGTVWGYCLARMFGRLRCHLKIDNECIKQCVTGIVVHVHKNDDWYHSWVWDADQTFDVIPIESHLSFAIANAVNIRCKMEIPISSADASTRQIPVIHCEIVSAIQNAACIGGMIGAAVGVVLGGLTTAALVGLSAACGPFILFCLLGALIVGAIIAAASSYIGGLVGAAIGSGIDSSSDILEKGETIMPGDHVTVRGEWINDADHGWNEIHPVTDFWLLARDENNELLYSEHAKPTTFEELHQFLNTVEINGDCQVHTT